MKIKVQYTFEGEIPEEIKDLAIVDWGDRGVEVLLTAPYGHIQMVLILAPEFKSVLLKTECLGYDVLEVL